MSGAVYVALIVCSILFGGEWAFPALMGLFVFVGIFEFQKMTSDDFYASPRMLLVDLLIGILLPTIVGLGCSGVEFPMYFFTVLVLILFMLRFVMQLYSRRPNPVRHIAVSVLSIIYIAVPLAMATCVNFAYPELLLLMFVMIWLNDTGAFLVGSAIGSHRLFERLSPKKSWEGFVGGLAFCVGAGYLAKALFPEYFPMISGNMLAAMGVVVGVMSTWGDLFESMIKRAAGVKDSGNIIPGHGGILDRIDSLLFVAPATLLMVMILVIMSSFEVIQGA